MKYNGFVAAKFQTINDIGRRKYHFNQYSILKSLC